MLEDRSFEGEGPLVAQACAREPANAGPKCTNLHLPGKAQTGATGAAGNGPEGVVLIDNLQATTFKLSGAEVDELEAAAKKAKKATQNIFQTA